MEWQELSWGAPPAERADAAHNRLHLLSVARQLIAEQGADKLTMDGMAERAGLGKGIVFRRFGSQLGIGGVDLDILAIQLTAALDGPLLLYLSAADLAEPGHEAAERIARSWQDLVERVCRP